MYTMSETTVKNIERTIGIPIERLRNMSANEEQEWILQKCESQVVFSKKNRHGIIGRGNPLLSRRKIRTFMDLDARSKKTIGI